METQTIFPDGIYLQRVSDKAPEFIKASVSIHVEKLTAWLDANKLLVDDGGYIRLTGKESKQGKRYFQVDQWKPTNAESPINPDNIPF